MDGRGIAAAFALGAAGVSLGTRFLVARESGIPACYRRRSRECPADGTVVTDAVTGRPARWIRNRFVDALVTAEAGTLGWGGQGALIARPARRGRTQSASTCCRCSPDRERALRASRSSAGRHHGPLARADERGPGMSAPVDLAGMPSGVGPLWGMQSEELNATLLEWPPGGGVAEHVNDELEVMLLLLAGSARVGLDGDEHELSAGSLLLIPRGCARSVSAGPDGVRYLSVHRRRGPLLPRPRAGLFDP